LARILILDDKSEDRAVLQGVLQEEGHNVDAAEHEEMGFSLLAAETFDLVLLDLTLPKKGGSRVLVQLVRDYPKLKILITARGGETISTRQYLKIADDRGTVRALPKPFDRTRLSHAVNVMVTGVEWRQPQRRDDASTKTSH